MGRKMMLQNQVVEAQMEVMAILYLLSPEVEAQRAINELRRANELLTQGGRNHGISYQEARKKATYHTQKLF